MTLAVVFKGAEGVVLAVDSRVTLTTQIGNQQISSHYDNATKLLTVPSQRFLAAITYGAGCFGNGSPRTPHSYLSEFEAELGSRRLSVGAFAQKLGSFFIRQHNTEGMPANQEMVFLVAGYDEAESYGRVFEVKIPTHPEPVECNANGFGLTYGGQAAIVTRLLGGIDLAALAHLKQKRSLSDNDVEDARREIQAVSGLAIPYQFLPLQDCVDLSVLLVKTTAQFLQYTLGTRGVGGALDVAAITKTDGLQLLKPKRLQIQ